MRAGQGMEIFLPSSKTDCSNRGHTVKVPALKRLCPVAACKIWVDCGELKEGSVFRAVDRWGHLGMKGLHPNSLSSLLRQTLFRCDLVSDGYSSHSLRRGFATWASHNQWSTKALMEYVGWRDIRSALRYVDVETPFAELRR